MKLENIKAALKARASSLNLDPQATLPGSSTIFDTSLSTVLSGVSQSELSQPKKHSGKSKPTSSINLAFNSSPQIPLIPAQIQNSGDNGNTNPLDKNSSPIADTCSDSFSISPPTEKPPRKNSTRKSKELPEPSLSSHIALPKNDIESIIAKHLKPGRDFDRLPNTSKPTLLKSGAEILAGVFGFRTSANVINRIENYDKQFVLYEVCVSVFDQDDKIVAVGLGSCNSRERKYLKSDFASNLNTILKIAKKRAFVDAILSATHASRVFTQDIEDIVNLQIGTDNHGVTSK